MEELIEHLKMDLRVNMRKKKETEKALRKKEWNTGEGKKEKVDLSF